MITFLIKEGRLPTGWTMVPYIIKSEVISEEAYLA